MPDIDVLVVGSGPAGAQAAAALVGMGLRIVTVDVGENDTSIADAMPVGSFSDLRRNDPEQWRYFVGHISESSVADIRVGAQLTPPRRYLTDRVEELAPIRSATFRPMQSLAKGGLGGGWGAGCETFTEAECERAGLDAAAIRACYADVAADIGISGSSTDDIAATMSQVGPLQPAAPIDDNAAALLTTYEQRREHFMQRGFRLGRPPIALLSERLIVDGDVRGPNPLRDLDFYTDAERSIYRPRFTVDRLRKRSNYEYRSGLLALRFTQHDDGSAELTCLQIMTKAYVTLHARHIILACGALNTARVVARSYRAYETRLPLVCNAYRYIPAVNLPMLGRPSGDRRHSMAQLAAELFVDGENTDPMFVAMYSYRSLLLYKLVKEMPLATGLGLLLARVLLSSLTVLGAHFPDTIASGKWIALKSGSQAENDVLLAEYAQSDDERRAIAAGIRRLLGVMLDLHLVPLSIIDSGFGASIHYAGPLSSRDAGNAFATRDDGALVRSPAVSIADSAAWRFLPAKGPTLTIMAHARDVAGHVARKIAAESQR